MEVSTLSREVMLPKGLTSVRSITERHSLAPPSHTRSPLGSLYSLLSHPRELVGRTTGLPRFV